jgi:peptidyl-tRNA hydrolase
VLTAFDEQEAALLEAVLTHSVSAIRLALSRGLQEAMTHYNGMTISEPGEDH